MMMMNNDGGSPGIYSEGKLLNGVQVKLVDWEEYTSNDKPFPRGEICVQSSSMVFITFKAQSITVDLTFPYFHAEDLDNHLEKRWQE